MHGEPLAHTLRRRFLVKVPDYVGPEAEPQEEHLRGDADNQPAVEVGVVGQILDHEERRGSLDRQLNGPLARQPLPGVEVDVEQRARIADDDRIAAVARVDAAALARPEAIAVLRRGLAAERPPTPLPAGDQQHQERQCRRGDRTPGQSRNVALGHGLRHAGTVRGGEPQARNPPQGFRTGSR